MEKKKQDPMGWPTIIGILIATALVTGLTLGLLGEVLGGTWMRTTGVGGAVGVVGAILISKRRAALRS